MRDSATSNSHITCIWDEPTRTVCADEPFYREHEGKRYCVLHFPDKEKTGDFEQALQRKIKNEVFDFRGVWFPDDLWLRREFKTRVNFSEATFNGRVGFDSAIFRSDVIFWDASFAGLAYFNSAVFECS